MLKTIDPKKVVMICSIGTILEWFDFSLFASMSSVFSELFFPQYNSRLGFIAVLLVFFTGFVARPIGGIVSGYIGDVYGRKASILISIIMMTVSTFSIGLLPTYESVGVLAPCLLILLRMLQGLSSSGEHTGSIVYLSESIHEKKRFYLSLIFCAVMFGNLLGSLAGAGLCHILTAEELKSFGWRIPFLSSIFLGFIGYLIRSRMEETNVFQQLKQTHKIDFNPVLNVFKFDKYKLLLSGGLFSLTVVLFYSIFIYLPSSLIQKGLLNQSTALTINSISIFIMCIFMLCVGYISEKANWMTFIKVSLIGVIIFTYPLLNLIESGDIAAILIAQIVFALLNALMLAPTASLYTELFSARKRYSGVSISINFSAAIFGGLSPVIMALLANTIHHTFLQSAYLITAAAISLICCIAIEKLLLSRNYVSSKFDEIEVVNG